MLNGAISREFLDLFCRLKASVNQGRKCLNEKEDEIKQQDTSHQLPPAPGQLSRR